MSKGIPEYVDLLRIAKPGGHYSGSISVARMPRFIEYLANKEGQINADIIVGTDNRRRAFIKGRVSGTVWVICQRCMQPMQYDIDTSFEMILVEFEHQLERLPDDVEAMLVSEVPASLFSIVEDELILGFSLVPMHKEEDCEATSYLQSEQYDPKQKVSIDKPNPFSVLKDFKSES
jgi:uncharacterized protein